MAMIEFESSRFGTIGISEETVITFPEGLIGFPQKRWVLLGAGEDSPFFWLHSLDDPDIALPVTVPEFFHPDYVCEIPDEAARTLKIDDEQAPVEVFCVVRAHEKLEDFTINLRGPIVINAKERVGLQVINQAADYDVRASLWEKVSVEQLREADPQKQPQTPVVKAEG